MVEIAVNLKENSLFLFIPPIIRFIMELSIWILFLVSGYWYLTLISMLNYALFNAKGDKRSIDDSGPGLIVHGGVRLLIELFWPSLCLLVILNSGQIRVGTVIIYVIVTIFWIIFDFNRLLWLLGIKDNSPEYVVAIHKNHPST